MIVFWGNRIPMKSSMVRVFQLNFFQSLIGVDMSMSDDLDLRLVRDGLQIWMQDAPLAVEGLAVSVGGG